MNTVNNPSLDVLEDLEIYLDTADLDAVQAWLQSHFGHLDPQKITGRTRRFHTQWDQQLLEIFVCRNAGQTGFTSVGFHRKNIPWRNDIECARAAHAALGVTVRCSESAWKEGDDPDQWYQVSKDGESVIHWKTED